jgi:hypothetical protein
MAFEPKDNAIYDELWDVEVAAAVTKGQAVVVQDVFGFYFTDVTAQMITDSRNEVAFIYRMRQVEAGKLTGTGEAIIRGDRVYATSGSGFQSVTANPTGTAGTDYYFCGWAKKSAAASATTVLINFDGTRYDENI